MWYDGFRPLQALERSSERTKLTLMAVASSALTVMALMGYQTARRRARSDYIKTHINDDEGNPTHHAASQHINSLGMIETTTNHLPTPPPPFSDRANHDQTLIDEQLARNQAFLGKEGLDKVRGSHVVVVVGVGSVGSWAALMLARSGVQHLRLVDPSVLLGKDITSHAAASPSTLGRPKVTALQSMVSPIAPFVHIETIMDEWQTRHLDPIKEQGTEKKKKVMVVDCLGNTSLDAKLKLITYCHSRRIDIVSALDPGNKVDPTRVQITDISDTFEDPSAKVIRRRLKLLGVDRHLPVACSIEKPADPKIIKDQQYAESIQDASHMPDIRKRHTPHFGAIAAMYGMSLTTYTLLHLADFTAYKLPALKLRDKLYGRIHQEVNKRERQHYPKDASPLTLLDVEYIYEEIWRGKSVISGPQERITLARWDRTLPLSHLNTVCMSKEEARAHDVLPMDTDLREFYGNDVVDHVEKQFAEQARFENIWQ